MQHCQPLQVGSSWSRAVGFSFSIGTRPFCIIAEVLSLLRSKLKHAHFYIWAENQRSSFLLWPDFILVHKTGKIFQNGEITLCTSIHVTFPWNLCAHLKASPASKSERFLNEFSLEVVHRTGRAVVWSVEAAGSCPKVSREELEVSSGMSFMKHKPLMEGTAVTICRDLFLPAEVLNQGLCPGCLLGLCTSHPICVCYFSLCEVNLVGHKGICGTR